MVHRWAVTLVARRVALRVVRLDRTMAVLADLLAVMKVQLKVEMMAYYLGALLAFYSVVMWVSMLVVNWVALKVYCSVETKVDQ